MDCRSPTTEKSVQRPHRVPRNLPKRSEHDDGQEKQQAAQNNEPAIAWFENRRVCHGAIVAGFKPARFHRYRRTSGTTDRIGKKRNQ